MKANRSKRFKIAEGDELFMKLNREIEKFLNSDEYMSKWSFEARQLATAKEDGIDIGVDIGRDENQREVVINMVKKNYEISDIADITNLKQKDVKSIINEYQANI